MTAMPDVVLTANASHRLEWAVATKAPTLAVVAANSTPVALNTLITLIVPVVILATVMLAAVTVCDVGKATRRPPVVLQMRGLESVAPDCIAIMSGPVPVPDAMIPPPMTFQRCEVTLATVTPVALNTLITLTVPVVMEAIVTLAAVTAGVAKYVVTRAPAVCTRIGRLRVAPVCIPMIRGPVPVPEATMPPPIWFQR
jgi:hypothetical protein